MTVIVETERLTLRHVRDDDLDVYAAMHAHPEVMRFSPERHPLSREETAALLTWIQSVYATKGYGLWAVVHTVRQEVIGYCGFTNYVLEGSDEVELGYRLAPAAWGQGFATEAAKACLQMAWHDMQLRRVVSLIEPENTASIRVAEKLGFRLERSLRLYDIPVDLYAVHHERLA
jgi:[ribosomal protein S5]-alanine N-acetyltransferase